MIKRTFSSTSAVRPQIRLGRETDIENLMSLENQCFIHYYEAHRFSPSHFKNYIGDQKQSLILIAHIPSILAGYIAGTFKCPIAHIDSVAVLPSLQKTGIGTKLINAFIKEAKERNCYRITLEVAAQNYAGQGFFEKLGFNRFRTVRSYYGAHSDAIKMRLLL